MTQDEIISMMKEAGFYFGKDDVFIPEWGIFANLVAAHEREACAKKAEEWLASKGRFLVGLAAAIRARGEK